MWLWLTESVPEAKGKDEEEHVGDKFPLSP